MFGPLKWSTKSLSKVFQTTFNCMCDLRKKKRWNPTIPGIISEVRKTTKAHWKYFQYSEQFSHQTSGAQLDWERCLSQAEHTTGYCNASNHSLMSYPYYRSNAGNHNNSNSNNSNMYRSGSNNNNGGQRSRAEETNMTLMEMENNQRWVSSHISRP